MTFLNSDIERSERLASGLAKACRAKSLLFDIHDIDDPGVGVLEAALLVLAPSVSLEVLQKIEAVLSALKQNSLNGYASDELASTIQIAMIVAHDRNRAAPPPQYGTQRSVLRLP